MSQGKNVLKLDTDDEQEPLNETMLDPTTFFFKKALDQKSHEEMKPGDSDI